MRNLLVYRPALENASSTVAGFYILIAAVDCAFSNAQLVGISSSVRERLLLGYGSHDPSPPRIAHSLMRNLLVQRPALENASSTVAGFYSLIAAVDCAFSNAQLVGTASGVRERLLHGGGLLHSHRHRGLRILSCAAYCVHPMSISINVLSWAT